ncbi:hypothetical protein AB0L65_00160 [Nonomuraea sp. NPDC052116]|uniref:hypothetical protein n=1 Tax=Nonomuraea sp. NPDC052116 TaxID=3155665 RepID=UPI0034158707
MACQDSVAHVALIVRRGATVVRLLWQGPAGADLAGALREGRTALIRTLDGLHPTLQASPRQESPDRSP